MDLATYLAKPGAPTQEELGARFDPPVTQSAISQWLRKRIPAERVLELERVTGGEVARCDARPDLYPRDEAAIVTEKAA